MKRLSLFGLLLLSNSIFAEPFAKPDESFKMISKDYYSGSFLIYDCWGMFWACVDDWSFNRCQTSRKETVENFESILSCMPIKQYKTPLECIEKQNQLIISPIAKDFCLHPINRI